MTETCKRNSIAELDQKKSCERWLSRLPASETKNGTQRKWSWTSLQNNSETWLKTPSLPLPLPGHAEMWLLPPYQEGCPQTGLWWLDIFLPTPSPTEKPVKWLPAPPDFSNFSSTSFLRGPHFGCLSAKCGSCFKRRKMESTWKQLPHLKVGSKTHISLFPFKNYSMIRISLGLMHKYCSRPKRINSLLATPDYVKRELDQFPIN